jgi:hypothetical protein
MDHEDDPPTVTAHGIITALVMVILYPFGSILMPQLGIWYIHAGFQMFSFLLMWIGFGLGVQTAMEEAMVSQIHEHSLYFDICLLLIPTLFL